MTFSKSSNFSGEFGQGDNAVSSSIGDLPAIRSAIDAPDTTTTAAIRKLATSADKIDFISWPDVYFTLNISPAAGTCFGQSPRRVTLRTRSSVRSVQWNTPKVRRFVDSSLRS